MTRISSIEGRILYNSRGSKTIEIDVKSEGKFLGRVCAPSGASVGKYEVVSFPNGKPEESLRILQENSQKFIGLESSDLKGIHDTLKSLDNSTNYSRIGGALAFAVTIASIESAAKAAEQPLFEILSPKSSFKFPFPLGNILGGGAHAGPGTPDIQEILICATGSKTIEEAIETNLSVHKELRRVLEKEDPNFTNGRGDEGGWAPKLENQKALEVSAKACENLGFTLGKEVSLGVDFASSTQWNEEKQKYVYDRAGFENSTGEQIDFVANIIEKYKLIFAEDAVHEEAFEDMAEITAKFPNTMVTGDDLIVTNKDILTKAIGLKSCNAAILKVNQAGSLYDALEFANVANQNNIRLITSHRSGESIDSQISHIGIATKSKMLKVGIIGGERIAKLNELLRLSEHDLIRGMAEI
ncbi:enolase [Marine Group I thaumarchaeote]|uniref:Enolase n=1 Tax=Marine Group I thaumarchaeote TaxID=2511932 RepID=A0A7K4N573_9ARCH|nr:MAG: enolase [Nitrosopumilus sp. YT1]NMI81795.1 enolase [Candidatus Nitrosopumilus sp. MTA1]NWJ19733.1 enolase [Marine Group I thaumarchaeote]NWJ28129.1 enolase [Marine Group I thaumarchaeote]NWJ56698.1 enolase [Marine Group I thaumarchaeote]